MKFADIKKPRRGALAQQGWLILIGHAKNWQVTTYQRMAAAVGQGQREDFVGTNVLDPVAQYCLQHDLPPLTALVLNKEKAKPGAGFPSYDEQAHRLVDVFEYDWYSLVPPSPEDLDQASRDAK